MIGPVADWVVPEQLAATADDEASALHGWYVELPDIVAGLTRRWQLRLEPPFQPGGRCSWVAPGVGPTGRAVVLKVGWRHPESVGEADGLNAWAGRGAVRLYDTWTSGQTDALLLERCEPGTPLRDALTEPAQDEVVAGLLRRLWRAPPPSTIPTLTSMCAEWAAEFEARDRTESAARLPADVAAEGIDLLRSLPTNASDHVLLCTDGHAGNVVAAQREPWLVIDPKPHVGDPTYDVLQHVLNCRDRLVADPHALVRRMAALLEVDPDRALLWLFARAVQESVDAPWLADVALRVRPA